MWRGGYAQAFGEGVVGIVVEVVLPAEKDHFVRDQCLIDRRRGLGIDRAQTYPIDACPDVLAQLHHT